jgi:hypothetical protein
MDIFGLSGSPIAASGAATTAPTASVSLRNKQIQAVKSMLQFNRPSSSPLNANGEVEPTALTAESVWKVLIYDQFGQDIISPLLKVSDLRDHGVTVHMQVGLFVTGKLISYIPLIF